MKLLYSGLKGAVIRVTSITALSLVGNIFGLMIASFMIITPTANLQNGAGFTIDFIKVIMIGIGMVVGVFVSWILIDLPIPDKMEFRLVIIAILPMFITGYYFSTYILGVLP